MVMEGEGDLINPMLISYFVPVLGGLYMYRKYRGSKPEASKVILAGAFGLPLSWAWLYMAEWGSPAYLGTGLLLFGLAYGLKQALKPNRYADMLYIYYLGVLGYLYIYFFRLSDPGMKHLATHFTLRGIAVSIIIALALGAFTVVLLAFADYMLMSAVL